MNLKRLFSCMAACAIAVSALAVSAFAADTTVFTGTATADGSWKQAITLTTLKNNNGTFDPAVLVEGCIVEVSYTSTSAPELVLQSWSGGKSWAKVAATTAENGLATYTYDSMVTAYESSDFVSTLDNFIVGDTGNALTVTQVVITTEAATTTTTTETTTTTTTEAAATTTAAVTTTTAADADDAATTTTAASNNTSADTGVKGIAVVFAVLTLAGGAAVVSRKKN